MIYYGLPNANASVISVTNTATLLKSLINTAGSASAVFPGTIDGIDLYVEDGDVRVLFDGNTPTSSKGILLKKGVYYRFRHIDFHKAMFIRTGSANVAVSLQIGFCSPEEVSSSSNVTYLAELLAGEDLTNDVIKTEQRFTSSGVLTADTQVKGGSGFIHSATFSCNDAAPTAGSIIIYDSLTEAGTQIFNHTFTTTSFVPFTVFFDHVFATGLYVGFTTTNDVNVSVSYR